MRSLLALLLFGAVLCAAPGDRIVKRDNGKRSGKQSVAVSGHAIALSAAKERPFVRSVLVYGARYGAGYDAARTFFVVAVCDETLRPLAQVRASYGLFRQHLFTWAEIVLEKPVRVPRGFKVIVDFRATDTRGVYVGYTDAPRSQSSYARTGTTERPFAKEWMIRARLSASAEPVPATDPDLRIRLRETRLERLESKSLADALARVGQAARVPVVLDPKAPGDAAAPAIDNASAEAALATLTTGRALAWEVRWGVVFVATPQRLEEVPVGFPEVATKGPSRPALVRLRAHLFRRRVDLDCRAIPLDRAVAQVADWLEFGVRWDPRVDRTQRVAAQARDIVARDALSLLLFPRGCGFRTEEGTVFIFPLPGQ